LLASALAAAGFDRTKPLNPHDEQTAWTDAPDEVTETL
jgi:hypothetical protein